MVCGCMALSQVPAVEITIVEGVEPEYSAAAWLHQVHQAARATLRPGGNGGPSFDAGGLTV